MFDRMLDPCSRPVACWAYVPGLTHSLPRRSCLAWQFIFVTICIFGTTGWVKAQEEAKPSDQSPVAVVDGLLQSEQKVYIQSEDGRPLVNYTLEELRELEKVYRQSKQMPAVLDWANVQAKVSDGVADIRADFGIELDRSGTIERLDLGLKNCQLTDGPKFESDEAVRGQAEYRVLPTQDGYQWLILSPEPAKHRLIFTGQSVIDRSVDRHNLTIDLPIVNSVIEINLPASAVEERVRVEDVIVNRTVDESGVTLEVRSRGGNFTLEWQQGRTQDRVGVVEAESETVFEPLDLMDPTQFWSATTTLNLRWYGDDGNSKVRIALPAGAQWNSLPYSEFERFRLTTVLSEPVAASSSADGIAVPPGLAGGVVDAGDSRRVEVLEIENLEPSEFPEVEDLKLQWRWLPVSVKSDRAVASYSVPTPLVTGTDRHNASVGIIFPRTMEMTYQADPSVRVQRRNLSEDSGFGRQQIQFAFPNAPTDLLMTFRQQQSLPTVRTTYRVHVRESQLELTAWVEGWFNGGAAELGVAAGDWVLDEQSAFVLSEPSAAYSNNATALSVRKSENGNWVLSSREEDTGESAGRASQFWRFKAYRSWDALSGQELRFDLPMIDRGIASGQSHVEHGSGLLLVSSDESLSLQPDPTTSAGLFKEALTTEDQVYLPGSSLTTTAYRFQSLSTAPKWVGTAAVLPQQIRMTREVELDIRQSQAKIRQYFDLQVSHRPLVQPKMMVRADVLPIQVAMGDFLVSYVEMPKSDAPSQAEDQSFEWREVHLTGMPALLGSARLTVESSVPIPAGNPNADATSAQGKDDLTEARVSLPLVALQLESGVSLSPLSCTVRANPNIDVSLASDNTPVSLSASGNEKEIELKSDQKAVDLIIRSRSTTTTGRPVTQGVWLQTLLAGTDRRDRFVARVRSENGQAVIQLPDQAQLDKVALDGILLTTELAPYDYNTNRVVVALPDALEHCVEAVYTLSEPLSWANRMLLKPAVVEDAQPQDRCYWQLVTPGIYHLGWCPPELTAEWRWQWSSLWWSRVSDKDQSSLERMLGARTMTRLPANTNSYTMSGLEELPVIEVWILSRFVMWLPMGLVTLIGSWLILSFPALRSPYCLVAAAVVILSGAMIWPDMSMLLGQTVVMTLSLVSIIAVTRYAVESRVRRRSVFAARPSGYLEGSGPYTVSQRARTAHSSGAAQSIPAEPSGVD